MFENRNNINPLKPEVEKKIMEKIKQKTLQCS